MTIKTGPQNVSTIILGQRDELVQHWRAIENEKMVSVALAALQAVGHFAEHRLPHVVVDKLEQVHQLVEPEFLLALALQKPPYP